VHCTMRWRRDILRAGCLGVQMIRHPLRLLVLGVCLVCLPARAATDAEQAMVGAWEISNAARDKLCPISFAIERVERGLKIELDGGCGTAFPSMKDIAAWAIGPKDSVQLIDSKGAVVLNFTEVETLMYEAERKGEGLYFMRTQAAAKAATVSPEQLFGEWTLLQEFEKPLCKLTLTDARLEGESYKLAVKPGCTAAIANFGFLTWRLAENELLLTGRAGTWRFSESDTSVWERVPPSTDPMLLMRQ
jgi:Protease inhibitor Inh